MKNLILTILLLTLASPGLAYWETKFHIRPITNPSGEYVWIVKPEKVVRFTLPDKLKFTKELHKFNTYIVSKPNGTVEVMSQKQVYNLFLPLSNVILKHGAIPLLPAGWYTIRPSQKHMFNKLLFDGNNLVYK